MDFTWLHANSGKQKNPLKYMQNNNAGRLLKIDNVQRTLTCIYMLQMELKVRFLFKDG